MTLYFYFFNDALFLNAHLLEQYVLSSLRISQEVPLHKETIFYIVLIWPCSIIFVFNLLFNLACILKYNMYTINMLHVSAQLSLLKVL